MRSYAMLDCIWVMVSPVYWHVFEVCNTGVFFEHHSRKLNILLCTVFLVHLCGTKVVLGQSVECGEQFGGI